MKLVDKKELPSIDDIIAEIPTIKDGTRETQNLFRCYLTELENQYKKNINKNLYDLNPHNATPIFYNPKKAIGWYSNYVRGKIEIFKKFPTVKNNDNQKICPFCETVFPSNITLEHVIPKNENGGDYRFAILPINLIKCCRECNTNTHSKKSISEEHSEIHPYEEHFEIDKYLEIEFKTENNRFLPQVKFKFEETIFDKRVEKFIENHKLENTYNHRIRLEYIKILTVLAKKCISLEKSVVQKFLEYQKKSFHDYLEKEKINNEFYINQNYFGYKICKELLKFDYEIKDFIGEVKRLIYKPNDLAMSNYNFWEDLVKVGNVNELDIFLSNNENDLRRYYEYIKNNKLSLIFPNLYESDAEKREVLVGILKYYLEKNKDFSSFKKNCDNIL